MPHTQPPAPPLLLPQGYGPFDHPAIAFNAVPARSRAQRRHVMNREEVERARLRERRSGFERYAEAGGLTVPDDKTSAMYAADQDRFNTDAAAEEKDARDEAAARRASEIERRRGFYAGQAAALREHEEAEARRWVEETAALQADGGAARRNRAGQPVDLLTQQYAGGAEGERLRAADGRVLARAAQRAQYLAEHSSGAATFNILSNAQHSAASDAVAQLATSLGVQVPAPIGVRHQEFVNASTVGPHVKVREETRSAPRLKNFIR
jgi:hypothetical protein